MIASLVLDVGMFTGPEIVRLALGWIGAGDPSTRTMFDVYGASGVLMMLVLGWLYAFLITSVAAAAPAVAFSWIAHAAAAPRPATEIVSGAAVGPLLLFIVASALSLRDSESWPIATALGYGLLFAFAGALGGFTYARVVGPRGLTVSA